jgi:hypothetical protein
MHTLPSEYTTILSSFVRLFSKRVWQHAQLLLIGAILSPGQRTVAAVLRIIGLETDLHFQTFHRVSIYTRKYSTNIHPGGNGGQIGEHVDYGYRPQMALNSVIGSSTYVQSSSYDAAGHIVDRRLGSSLLKNVFTYYPWTTANGQGRLQSLYTGLVNPPKTTYQNLAYTYDAVGNPLSIVDYIMGNPQTQTFTYDALNRLTGAQADGGTGDLGDYPLESYTYDASGRLNGKAGVSYTYDATQPHAVDALSNGWNYRYDANGSMTHRLSEAGSFVLGYDAENRMITTTNETVFADSFEIGSLSGWAASQPDGGHLSVSTAAAMGGTYGMQAAINDNNPLYVEDDSPAFESGYRARFYLKLNNIAMTNGIPSRSCRASPAGAARRCSQWT